MKKINYLFFALLTMSSLLLSSCGDDEDPINITPDGITLSANENLKNGAVIGSFNVTTNRGVIAYALTDQNPAGAMAINGETGELTVANASLFDFETNPTITATPEATVEGVSKSAQITVNLTNRDDIADLLTTSATAYGNASANDWVKITEAEYDNLMADLNETSRNGLTDSMFTSVSSNAGANNYTVASIGGGVTTIPANSYTIAFKYQSETVNVRSTDQVKVSDGTIQGTYKNVGNTLVSHSGAEVHYFVIKGNSVKTGNTEGHLGFYSSNTTAYTNFPLVTNYYVSGNQNTISSTENINYYFQSVSTTQKQW